ncbi:MAG: TonB-dependent receptor [Bacteroides sp.]|nr:TonB-dependent receptor [Bacteroides sp.]
MMRHRKFIRIALNVLSFLRMICVAGVLFILPTQNLHAQKITVNSYGRSASEVFADVMRQSGKNFIYSSDILKDLKISINVKDKSLKYTLKSMFEGTDIGYKIKGNNILLVKKKRKKVKMANGNPAIRRELIETDSVKVGIFRDLVVVESKNKTLSMNSSSIGALNVSGGRIGRTPVILGEADVVKTLQFEPGVSGGVEGTAGMYVHGGNKDENLFMLENIPLYQVNHFGGLFSAFNAEAIKSVDFFKSTFPAKFDGRLSSYMDVYTKDGGLSKLKGSFKIGLTSGAFHIDGPLWKDRTTYSLSIRRSWYEVLTLPGIAIANSFNQKDDDDFRFGYAFTDINAKITHRFSSRSRVYAIMYYGEDYLRSGSYTPKHITDGYYSNIDAKLRWGNILASAGWIYDFTPNLWGKISGAFTRYYTSMGSLSESADLEMGEKENFVSNEVKSKNNIEDWILKGDFEWKTSDSNRLMFGTSFVYHTFLPSKDSRTLITENLTTCATDNDIKYHARELNIYAEDNLKFHDKFMLSAGLHYSLFDISGKVKKGLSPRVSFKYSLSDDVVIKGGYSHAVQYVHQLSQSSISLPTDQWVPVIGEQKAQTSDKIAIGSYWNLNNKIIFTAEAYYKWMNNIIDYQDEYYMLPPELQWNAKLTEGRGTAKGLDFKISKEFGKVTGQVSYSLLWADRQFPDKNGGKKFPARFDNRHKINVLLNWKINDKWELNASWIGMSGNLITLPLQCWMDPGLGPWHYDMMLKTDVNNYRLPFYHRLDLSFIRYTHNGYWTFGLYNAYCNMNTIAVRLDYSDDFFIYETMGTNSWQTRYYGSRPVFQKIKLLPTIPSISYTWLF